MPHRRPKRSKVHTGIINLKFDKREMVTQQVVFMDSNDQVLGDFYLCRFYGSRNCWIDIKVLSPQMQERVLASPLLLREVKVDDGQIIRVIAIDWMLEHCNPDARTRAWVEGVSSVFDRDNSGGQRVGQVFYRNP